MLVVVARTLAAGTEFFNFALPDARPRRTRIALARSERPSERHCTLNVGAPPRARCILSYFLRDQLYPGIRDKNGKRRGRAVVIAAEVLSGKRFVCEGAGIRGCFSRALPRGSIFRSKIVSISRK